MRRYNVFPILLMIFGMFLAACTSNEANRTEPVSSTTGGSTTTASPAASVAARDFAFLRVIHAVPGGGPVDVVTDRGTSVSGASYKQVTPYAEVHSEQQNIRIVPAGTPNAEPLANNREIMVAGHHYTALVTPNTDGTGVNLRIIDDNITPPDTGRAKVRVIHASPDAGEVDVYARGNNTALFSGVNYQTTSSYNSVTPMVATLELRPAGQQRAALVVPNARFEAGKLYTVVVSGRAKGTPKLEATIIQDELVHSGAAMTSGSPTPTATVR